VIGVGLRTLRERWTSLLGTFAMVALGVALVAALGLVMAAADADPGDRWEGLLSVLGMMAMLTGFVSVFVISSTFAFSVAQRRREFALLRALGAAPHAIRLVLLTEALVVAAAGGLLGCALGAPLAGLLVRVLAVLGAPEDAEIGYRTAPLVLAFTMGLVVTVMGVWAPARRVRRVRPIEALRDASVEQGAMTAGRWVLGVAAAAGTAAVARVAVVDTGDGAVPLALLLGMGAITALAFLSPVVVPALAAALTWPVRFLPGAGPMLVREGMRAGVRRTAALAAPVLVTIGLAGSLMAVVMTTSAAAARSMAAWTDADLTVSAAGPEGLTAAEVDRIAGVPGAAAVPVRAVAFGVADGTPGTVPALTADGAALARAIDPPAADGAFRAVADGGIAVDVLQADALGWAVGDRVELELPGGVRARTHVGAVLAEGLHNGQVYLPASLLGDEPEGPVLFAYVDVAPGADAAAVAAALEDAVAGSGARVDPVGAIEPGRQENDRMVVLFGAVMLGTALLCSGLSIANTLVMAASDRVRDLGALRLAGAGRGQVLRLVAAEAVAVVGVGTVLGLAATGTVLLTLRSALGRGLGGAAPMAVSWEALAAIAAVCALVAVPSAVAPAWAATRGRVAAPNGERG
jgi:putative ABC transport system permease protein